MKPAYTHKGLIHQRAMVVHHVVRGFHPITAITTFLNNSTHINHLSTRSLPCLKWREMALNNIQMRSKDIQKDIQGKGGSYGIQI